MKKIYVLLMQTHTITDKLIRFFTRYEYSHVAISLNKECSLLYSFGRKRWNVAWIGGYTIENKNGKFFKNFKETECKIYELEVTDSQYEKTKDILSHMNENRDDYKYDYFGIILRFFGIPVKFKKRYVCSFFVASVLKQADVHDFGKDTCWVIPSDFEKINSWNIVYRGNFCAYK